MRYTQYLTALAFASGAYASSQIQKTETVYIVEYTEVCQCPSETPVLFINPPITTLTCCDTCAPITITATDQLVTSCTTSATPTTTICDEEGVYRLGDDFYPCYSAPCTIQYNVPCPTCYVCPYYNCWAPGAMSNSSPKSVQVYAYNGSSQIGSWQENWSCSTWEEYYTRTTSFTQPTIFIENNITIDITVVPTVITYTQTSTVTTTSTATTTYTEAPTSHSPTAPPTSPPVSTPHVIPSSSSSSEGPVPTSEDLRFVLHSLERSSLPVIIKNSKLAYGSANQTTAVLRLDRGQLFDLSGNIVYISTDELSNTDSAYLYFIDSNHVPSDGLTQLFSTDADHDMIVTVSGRQLLAKICNNDGYLHFGYSKGDCEDVTIAAVSSSVSSTSTTPSSTPSTTPASVTPSSPSSIAPEPSTAPASSIPASTPASSSAPVSSADPQPSSSPSQSPSGPPSSSPSSAPSSAISSNPSSSPSASPTPVSYSVSRAYLNPENLEIDQGPGQTLFTDAACVKLTFIDSNNQTVPANVSFNFACADDAFCSFALPTNTTQSLTTFVTNGNGQIALWFSSMYQGTKTILVTDSNGNAVASYTAEILPVVNPNLITLLISPSNYGPLLLGEANPSLAVTVKDLTGDFIVNKTVVFYGLIFDGFGNSFPTDNYTVLTDETGTANLTDFSGDAIPGAQQWSYLVDQFSGSFQMIFWAVDDDCTASTLNVTPSTPYQGDIVMVYGHIARANPSASFNGATVQTSDDLSNLYLDEYGNFAKNLTYNPTVGSSLSITASLNWANSFCNLGPVSITWQPNPDCSSPFTRLNVVTPEADIGDLAEIDFQIWGPDGYPTGPIMWTVISQEDSGVNLIGMTDSDGNAQIYIDNNNYGPGDQMYIITIGSGDHSCSMEALVTWILDP